MVYLSLSAIAQLPLQTMVYALHNVTQPYVVVDLQVNLG